jgi:hypothetical protein
MSSPRLDPDTLLRYSRQSAVEFALATWRALLATNLSILFSPCSLYRALAVQALEVLPKFRGVFLSTLRFPVTSLSIEDFAAAVGDVASNPESHQSFILRDVNNVWITFPHSNGHESVAAPAETGEMVSLTELTRAEHPKSR